MSSAKQTRKIMQRILASSDKEISDSDVKELILQVLRYNDELAVQYLGTLIFQERDDLAYLAKLTDGMAQETLSMLQDDVADLEQKLDVISSNNARLTSKSESIDIISTIAEYEQTIEEKYARIQELEQKIQQIQQELITLEMDIVTTWKGNNDGADKST